jgi:P27 family predicted phage terminase small subunit
MPGGRPAKPTRIKELQGNPGKRALNKSEPRYSADGLTCPRWLNAEAHKEWRRVVKLLLSQRVATAADRGALAAYCLSYARWQQAEAVLDEVGLTVDEPVLDKKGELVGHKVKPRPEVAIAQQYQRLMTAAAAHLGLDPSSRSKVSVVKEERGNPILELLKQHDQSDAQASR